MMKSTEYLSETCADRCTLWILGETHTLEVPEGVDEMVTIFHVTGAYVYVDPHGKAEKIEDCFTKLQLARDHYEKVYVLVNSARCLRYLLTVCLYALVD